MTHLQRTVELPCSDRQLFELINDIEAYPHYMDGCVAAEVHHRSGSEMEASLTLAKRGYRYSFTTRNRLTPYSRISLQLVEGPFSHFAGEWQIEALAEDRCRLTLELDFTLQGPRLLTMALKPLLQTMADRLVDTMIKRSRQLHG